MYDFFKEASNFLEAAQITDLHEDALNISSLTMQAGLQLAALERGYNELKLEIDRLKAQTYLNITMAALDAGEKKPTEKFLENKVSVNKNIIELEQKLYTMESKISELQSLKTALHQKHVMVATLLGKKGEVR